MFIVIVVVVLLLIYIISQRNKFNKLKKSIEHQASNIGIQKKKHDRCLNDALNIAKLSYMHEVEGIERLTARDQLDQLAFLGQKYPSLQFVGGYMGLINDAQNLNMDITASMELLDGNIREYNEAISNFPGLLVAAMFGYKPEKQLDAENEAENRRVERETVDFSRF